MADGSHGTVGSVGTRLQPQGRAACVSGREHGGRCERRPGKPRGGIRVMVNEHGPALVLWYGLIFSLFFSPEFCFPRPSKGGRSSDLIFLKT